MSENEKLRAERNKLRAVLLRLAECEDNVAQLRGMRNQIRKNLEQQNRDFTTIIDAIDVLIETHPGEETDK